MAYQIGTSVIIDDSSNILNLNNISASGIITAASFSGDGSGLIGVAATDNVRTDTIVVSGVSTLGNTIVGGATTELIVEGDARVTGILTIGTSSITLDGTENQVNVGTGVTLHHSNGIQVGGNTLHSTGLTINNLNSTGVVTSTSFNVGTAVTINSSGVSAGVITATSFSGNGSALTGIVAATASNLNSSGVSTVSTLKYSNESSPLIIPTGTTYQIYISDSGNDSTGDGSSGSPYRSLQKAFDRLPRFIMRGQVAEIRILGSSYTADRGADLFGYMGGGNNGYYNGDGLTIRADGGTAITFNRNDHGIGFYDVQFPIRFKLINFVIPNTSGYNGLYFSNCEWVQMYDNCSWTTGSTYGWSYGGGVRAYLCKFFGWGAPVTVNSSSTPSLGGLMVFDRCRSVYWSGNISKSGTKWGQAALVAVNNTWIEQVGTINNFDTAIRLGINHYSAEDGAQCLLGNSQFTNCTYGVRGFHSSSLRAYYVTNTSGTGTVYNMNSGSHQH